MIEHIPFFPFLVGLYFLAVIGSVVYCLICLARITAALQGIAASLRRTETQGTASAPETVS